MNFAPLLQRGRPRIRRAACCQALALLLLAAPAWLCAQPLPAPWPERLSARDAAATRAALPADRSAWPVDGQGYGLLHRASSVEAEQATAPQFAALLSAWTAAGGSVDVAAGPLARTPLHQAAGADCAPCVQLLLAAGADPARADRAGRVALHFAGPRSIPRLIGTGPAVDVADAAGWTPLHWAAWVGDVERLRMLLTHGADPSRRSTAEQVIPGDRAWGGAPTRVAAGQRALDLARRRHDDVRWSTGRYAEPLAVLDSATPRAGFWSR